jgi:hypothetical protein
MSSCWSLLCCLSSSAKPTPEQQEQYNVQGQGLDGVVLYNEHFAAPPLPPLQLQPTNDSVHEDEFFDEDDQSIDRSSSTSSIDVNHTSNGNLLPLPLFSTAAADTQVQGEVSDEFTDTNAVVDVDTGVLAGGDNEPSSLLNTTTNFSLQMLMLTQNQKLAQDTNINSTIKKRLRQSTSTNRKMNLNPTTNVQSSSSS